MELYDKCGNKYDTGNISNSKRIQKALSKANSLKPSFCQECNGFYFRVTLYCKRCGNRIAAYKYCPKCGQRQ